jgi:hypothetical protein
MGDPGRVQQFDIPADFDFSKSTNDNYANDDITEFVGIFSDIRETLDYSYHVNYTPKRQLWQDTVISSVVVRTVAQTQPYATSAIHLLLTCKVDWT